MIGIARMRIAQVVIHVPGVRLRQVEDVILQRGGALGRLVDRFGPSLLPPGSMCRTTRRATSQPTAIQARASGEQVAPDIRPWHAQTHHLSGLMQCHDATAVDHRATRRYHAQPLLERLPKQQRPRRRPDVESARASRPAASDSLYAFAARLD